MTAYSFRQNCKVYIVRDSSRYKLEVYPDLEFSQTFEEKAQSVKTLHDQSALFESAIINKANPANFSFTVILGRNFKLLADWMSMLLTYDVYVDTGVHIYKLEKGVIERATFNISTLITVSLSGTAAKLTKVSSIPGTLVVVEQDLPLMRSLKVTYGTNVLSRLASLSVEYVNNIQWIEYDTLHKSLYVTNVSDTMYPENFVVSSRTLSGTIQRYLLEDAEEAWKIGVPINIETDVFNINIPSAVCTIGTTPGDVFTQNITFRMNSNPTGFEFLSIVEPSTPPVGSSPALVSAPTIKSSPTVARTLVATPGVWTNATGVTKQWFADGTQIIGATGNSLTLTDAHIDAAITYRENATNANGSTASTSNSLISTRTLFSWGQSNDMGARNSLAELPAGYVVADNNFKIWNVSDQTIKTLVPGTMELQPGVSLVDPAYTNTVGPLGEFIKFFRLDNAPSIVVHAFTYVVGGSRFTDAGSLGRNANWNLSLTDGAWNGIKTQWAAYLLAANASGRAPYVVQAQTGLGYNSAENSTEANTYQTDMGGLIAAIRIAMIGNSKVVIERFSNAVSGFSARATVRAAQAALVTADPSRMEMINTDGYKVGADGVHFDAASFMALGEALYFHYSNKWYPEKDIQALGATIYPTAVYRAGDLRGSASRMWDSSGNARHLDQADANQQPALVTATLSNGLVVRRKIFDAAGGGSSDCMVASGAFALAQPTGYGCFAAVKATTTSNAILIGEGSNSDVLPLGVHLMGKAGGALTTIYRDTGDNIPEPLVFPTLANNAFNGVMNFVGMTDTTTSIQGHVNGTAGTPLSYSRGTGAYSTNQTSIGALKQQGDPFLPMAATVGIIWYTNTVPDAAYIAKARAFTQYRLGTI